MRQHIIDITKSVIQQKGYHAFSYRDISKAVGIKHASIHYHFPTKIDLVTAIVSQERELVSQSMEQLLADKQLSSIDKLMCLCDHMFNATYNKEKKMCIGGMLAADIFTLDSSITKNLRLLFQSIEQSIAKIIEIGQQNKEFNMGLDPHKESSIIIEMVEGALLLARLYNDNARLVHVKQVITERLTA